jgi:hypothetical protein
VVDATGTLRRHRSPGLDRDVQLGGGAALARRVDVGAPPVAAGRRVVARLRHAHQPGQDLLGGPELGHADDDRPEAADLMLGRHRAAVPWVRAAGTAVVDE